MKEPIAIVSRACLFPGSLSPQALWKNLWEGKDLLSPPDPARWGVDPGWAMEKAEWKNPGGYVTGFEEIFDPQGFALPPEEIRALPLLHQWVLHTAREAYLPVKKKEKGKAALILGNLSLPSEGLGKWAEKHWKKEALPPRYFRFMSGLPAHLVGPALGRDFDAFALDAACASSLYALHLGCEKLRRNQADLVLAGAVNRADPLFLNIGFQALKALSPTGQSRPFHRDADGLVPTEGAAFVALKRLGDALECGDQILGVIHNGGLSNDGRSDGLLVPAGEGQVRAIGAAYRRAGIAPEEVSYIECHATGTAVGDGREVQSLAEVFGPQEEPILLGSHKSNMGHAITAAGMAGLLKVLGSFEHEALAPTIHVDKSKEIDLFKSTPFEIVTAPQGWEKERKIAAISAFGFGGNNSHLLVEDYRPGKFQNLVSTTAGSGPGLWTGFSANLTPGPGDLDDVVIVSASVLGPEIHSYQDFAQALATESLSEKPLERIDLPLKGLRFPPRDLEESLPQQLAILRAAHDAVAYVGAENLPRESTGVFIGMGTDPEIVRHGLRARCQDRAQKDKIAAPLSTAAVVGSLPNIVANRINSHLDLGGYSFAVSAEEHSGDMALASATDALQAGDLHYAVVGAVEMGSRAVHRDATERLDGDYALAFVLTTRSLAKIADLPILGRVKEAATPQFQIQPESASTSPVLQAPVAHAATGLLRIAAALALENPALNGEVETPALGTVPRKTSFQRAPEPFFLERPRVHIIEEGDQKAAVVAASQDELETQRARFQEHLKDSRPLGAGIYAFTEPLGGEVAQVFTGAAAAYQGMGRALIHGFPHLVESFRQRFANLPKAAEWMCAFEERRPTPLEKLFASSVLSQLHSDLTRHFLKIPFDAAIGFSSGETNALFAAGIWQDFDGLYEDFLKSGAFTEHLGGQFLALQEAWAPHLDPGEAPSWESWRLVGDEKAVKEALLEEPLVSLILINAPSDLTIGGHKPAVERLLAKLPDHHRSYLDYDIAVHIDEIEAYRQPWQDLHTREVHPTDLRIYSHGFLKTYTPTKDSVAQAILAQGTNTVDFPAMIELAYADGIRTFVEHGPRTTLGPWIRAILGERPHQVVSLDSGSDSSLRPLANSIARLLAAGIDVDVDAYNDHLERPALFTTSDPGRTLSFAAQPTPVVLMDSSMQNTQKMPPAPKLPSVLQFSSEKPNQVAAAPQQVRPQDAPTHQQAQGQSQPELPAVFHYQTEAFQQFMNLVASQSAVHQQYLHLAHQSWQHFQSPALPEGSPGVHPPGSPALYYTPVQSPTTSSTSTAPALPEATSTSTNPALPESSPGVHPPGSPALYYTPVQSPTASSSSTAPAPPEATSTSTNPALPEGSPGVHPPGSPALYYTPVQSPTTSSTSTAPKFTRQDLEHLATHKISDIFGPLFSIQDDYPRQVRMPEPPLLLADRVMDIDAEPGVVSTGTIWTETDITADAWYLFNGHIPPGVMIEAGQADLLLISWMGADFENRGERIYRLLGCELTYKRGLPQVGDTLKYDIHIDGHANQGPVRIFFFHYDCRVDDEIRLSVRHGQAGFFTDEELANSNGILWTPETGEKKENPRLDPPRVDAALIPRTLSAEQVQALADGAPGAAFSRGYECLQTHTRTPNIHHGKMCFVGEVLELDINGGPWGRGYMKTRLDLKPDHWFFEGHFKNDPCMPGTLMFEGGMQLMHLYMIALGFTLDKDGWRFEPAPDVPYQLRCRGQAIPTSRELLYEIFIEEVIDGDEPRLVADILATVDGLKAFHCRGMEVQLVPDTPLKERLLLGDVPKRDEGAVRTGGVLHDKLAILGTGNGPASFCLGPRYTEFDGHRRLPRLPGEPFQFMTRVTTSTAEPGSAREGDQAVVEYDIPDAHTWYFQENDRPVMPYAVLLEAALQPCGWLSLNTSAILDSPRPLYYRNLDGTGTLHKELPPNGGTLQTRTTLTRQSRSGGMVIQCFDVQCTVADELIFEMETTFGFFPQKALENQVGIPKEEAEIRRIDAPATLSIDVSQAPDTDYQALWPSEMLRMIDRITTIEEDPETGALQLRAEKDIDPAEWFFKAHFFQDPVQPGSLGVEAMIQTLRFALLHQGLHRRFQNPIIEPIALKEALTWTYRGQVLPENKLVQTLLDVHEIIEGPDETIARASASLWVDGLKIYAAQNLALRISEEP